ncbi:lysylphosphatidylglycerol synthase transmembrane domain-containing protein [uncultured Nonlabens sp.]|uniref:lysylphosphatidylglycerol synthase transmembrane domain-containing protein n=1 Tax=uncultured Nonlabens sp. TaxID=859306 RepID=UPI0026101529|nr:lysylphosphatidylglycerol synthase transmembrane domain-containing protein [uncultured Nonlabens sp.]
MKPTAFKIIKIALPLLLGFFLIYISYNQFTDEERKKIYFYLLEANYSWIALAITFAFLSHLSRAWRWNYMLESLGKKPKFITNVMAVGAGYAMNLIIPRSGEISRAAIINRSDHIPMDKAIGTIIAERVLDLIILLIITATAVLSAGDAIISFFKERLESAFAEADPIKATLYLAVFLLIIISIIYISRKFQFLYKVKDFLIGMKEGFMTIWTMKKKWLYFFHTLFIWGMYLVMFYVSFYAIPGIETIPISAILCAFVAGSFAVAFTNGGFGAYPYFIAQVLLVFGISETLGTSFGWILWLSQTILVLVYGLISLLLLSLRGSLSSK